jgi:dTDP-glucose 4,6-dehydratase
LITGGAGFIGSNFIRHMLRQYPDYQLVNLDKLTYAGNLDSLKAVGGNPNYRFVHGDIGDPELVERLFVEHSFGSVVNFAAESHVDRSIHDPEVFVRTNVLGAANLLQIAKKHWIDRSRVTSRESKVSSQNPFDNQPPTTNHQPPTANRFLQISTDEVYGSLGPEGHFTESTSLDPRSPYSASKAGADLLVQAYYHTYQLPVNITRCSNNYGPFQFPEKLVPLMIYNALQKKELPVYGDGLNVRDWIYVTDHCRAIDRVLHDGRPGEIYNIGSRSELTNIELVRQIINCLHERVDPEINESLIRFVTDRKGHDRRYAIDPAKIEAELGWWPEVSFEEGIEQTIQWYLDNPEWLVRVASGEYRKYMAKMYPDN